MQVLYLSAERAALPDRRGAQPHVPRRRRATSTPYVKRAACDAADRFSFAGLPDGAWYAITIAKPVGGAGPSWP